MGEYSFFVVVGAPSSGHDGWELLVEGEVLVIGRRNIGGSYDKNTRYYLIHRVRAIFLHDREYSYKDMPMFQGGDRYFQAFTIHC